MEADEIVNEALARWSERPPILRTEVSIYQHFSTFARVYIRDQRHKDLRQKELLFGASELNGAILSNDPTDDLEHSLDMVKVLEDVQGLFSEEARTVLELVIAGHSKNEIAKRLGVSRPRLSRILESTRHILSESLEYRGE